MSSTDNNTGKRNAEKQLKGDTMDTPFFSSPLAKAEHYITLNIQSLDPTTHKIVLGLGKEYLLLVDQHKKQIKTYESLKKEDFIPRSIRFKFTLTARKEFAKKSDFKTNFNEVDDIMKDFQKQLKAVIVRNAKQDLEFRVTEIGTNITKF